MRRFRKYGKESKTQNRSSSGSNKFQSFDKHSNNSSNYKATTQRSSESSSASNYSQRRGGGNFRGSGSGSRFSRPYGNRRNKTQTSLAPERFIAKAKKETEKEIFVPNFNFSDIKIHPQIKENILSKGFKDPTPIQNSILPKVIEGVDVLGIANTGTGKTGAFLIPLINKITLNRNTKILILAPTRELAEQINDELKTFARGLKIYSVKCVGGDSIYRQIDNLRRGFSLVIATPGRLQDLVKRGEIFLNDFNVLVLDEVDRMLDMGFVDEIQYIISQLPKERHSLCFSATVDRKVELIINTILKPNYFKIDVSESKASENIEQDVIYYSNYEDKLNKLVNILTESKDKKIIIFTNTKREVDKLDEFLYKNNFRISSIHGDKRQNYRRRAIEKLKDSSVNILIATDVAARGLDINNVHLVINYDVPNNHEDYIHRIGRTGRANKSGSALTFIPKR